MDSSWRIKLNEWSEEMVGAMPFFEELRILFTMEEMLQQFPVLLEHYLRRDIRRRLTSTALRTAKADFHIQAIVNYLESSEEGLFVIDRHFPPDLVEDRGILLRAFELTCRGMG
ncbi:MAG: hypothetical protein CME16_07255 [Gemmatimonadetes bacterium]|nr:hypothetical protein [Gemmatimonadota bacterium]|tara:strand:+ start:358 stop:699 length:342 start_codon:yes stop_codon:yes gene_type:complete